MATAQVPTGHFSIEIGGKERTGRIDMEGLCEIETALDGISLMDTLSGAGKIKWGFNITCTVLWVGLKSVNEKITKKHITTWIQTAVDEGEDLTTFVRASQMAFITSLGVKVREGAEELLETGKLPSVDAVATDKDGKVVDADEGGEGGKRPLPKKNLRSA